MGGIVKFVYGTSQHTKSGTTRKTEVQTVRKQQPNLQMQAYSINLYSVFDIASALQ